MKVIIVHGIHTESDCPWMEELAKLFNDVGLNTYVWTYGYAYALLTRVQNPGRAKKLRSIIEPGDIVVGHSNGCALAWMATQGGATLGGAVLINPALDTDKVFPEQTWVNLYPNIHDEAVKLALVFRAHPWGAQGRYGIDPGLGAPGQYLTRFTSSMGPNEELPVAGHSAVLAELPTWGKLIVNDVLDRIALPLEACKEAA